LRVLLIDTDVLIEVSRGRDRFVLAQWEEVGRENSFALCSPVTIAELWRGVRPYEQLSLIDLLSTMTCIPIDAEVGRRAGDYMRQFAKSHRLEIPDALIAATASVHNLQLWTRNRRHYPMQDIAFY
jgi:predicted nucleic acid-binding protein